MRRRRQDTGRALAGPGLFHGAAALLATALVAAAPARAADLRVEVVNLRSDRGVLMIGVYDSDEGFARALDLYDRADGFVRDRGRVAGAALRAAAGRRAVTFAGLPPGRYAVIAFHDEDADGRLDKTMLGIPDEGYGFSNAARGFLGPPGFADAAFALGRAGATATVRLSY